MHEKGKKEETHVMDIRQSVCGMEGHGEAGGVTTGKGKGERM